jgi:hypothetical protein
MTGEVEAVKGLKLSSVTVDPSEKIIEDKENKPSFE